MGKEPRQTTSNVGHLNKPSIQALIHGLNRHYYSAFSLCPFRPFPPSPASLLFLLPIPLLLPRYRVESVDLTPVSPVCACLCDVAGIAIDYKKTEGEQGMLMNLHKKGWTEGLKLDGFEELRCKNEGAVKVRFSSFPLFSPPFLHSLFFSFRPPPPPSFPLSPLLLRL